VQRFRLIALVAGALAFAGPAAASAAPELATSDRLDDRRYVASGTRAYSVGTEAGRFPAMGFHTRGEMGGIWTPPLKLVDGVWFAIDGQWIGPATRFASGWGYVEMDLPETAGVRAQRVEFAPDGSRGMLIGLRLTAPAEARQVDVWVDAHSELMGAYPWGETTPSQLTVNGQDSAAPDAGRLLFQEPARAWAALVGARQSAAAVVTGTANRGPQDPPVICGPSGEGQPDAPARCDDTAYGRGAGGRLTYPVSIPAGATRTLWIGVAGSGSGPAGARAELDKLLADPEGALRRKVARRVALSRLTRLSLPGDPLLARGIDWSKQNLADSVQVAENLQVRETNAGERFDESEGLVRRVRYLGAGWPDYPWIFATDGEYTAFASVALGQFRPAMDHLRALRDVSVIDNGPTGKVVHEVVSDGTVYFGSNADEGNTDETVKFPSALALLWRWTGNNRFRDRLYPFARRGMRTVWRTLDADSDGWPEGLGNVEREGMGEEKLDVTVYGIRGLLDLADMARAKRDRATVRWAEGRARAMRAAFEASWWMPEIPAYADSLDDPGNLRTHQRHWIGVTPMEVELVRRGRVFPGLAKPTNAGPALNLRESSCYADEFGLYHTGGSGCDPGPVDDGEKQAFTLNSAVMAVAEGNYGRLGESQQRVFTHANRRLQLPFFDEQPGAMPEIAPSPMEGRTIDRPFNERPSVLQAWGSYGTAWPVVHQHLGLRPDLGRRRLEVVPQLPPYERRIAGSNIRLGSKGRVRVVAAAGDGLYRTLVRARVELGRLVIGHTLPRDELVSRVLLDGRRVFPKVRRTNRGLEILVRVPGRLTGRHRLVIEAR
jgi:hypothetical protein